MGFLTSAIATSDRWERSAQAGEVRGDSERACGGNAEIGKMPQKVARGGRESSAFYPHLAFLLERHRI